MASDPTKTVLCFGDSNTWGHDPVGGRRFPRGQRWSGRLAAALGQGWEVVEAGLGGRTTVFEDPLADRCGARHLLPVLESAKPLQAVVLLLGTNDLKQRFGASSVEIADGAGVLVDKVLRSGCGPDGLAPRVLLLAPPALTEASLLAQRDPQAHRDYLLQWGAGIERSRDFARQYRRVADARGVAFLDAGAHARSSEVDGIHWEAEAHAALAAAVAGALLGLFAQG